MTIIIPKYSSSKIIEPTAQDYQQLGIEQPGKSGIQLASLDEIKDYAGVDLTFGIPIVKKGFFSNKTSPLYAPSNEDCARLGIRNDFAVDQNDEVMRKSYSIEDGVAYVADSQGSLVETMARSASVAGEVLKKGAINLRLLGLPLTGIVLKNPEVETTLKNNGTKLVDTLYPAYRKIIAAIPDSSSKGITSNGLEYALY